MKVHKKSEAFTNFNIGASKEAEEINNSIDEVTSTKYVVENIPIEDIEFNPKNTRFNDEDTEEEIEDLAENIKLYGLFHPIGVFPRGNKYMLFSGERRTKAFKKLGKRYIPAMIFPDMGDFGNMERLYQANLQSRMLDVRKRFLAFKDLLSDYESESSVGQTDIADKLRITRATVQKYKELYQNAEEGDFELLESGEITWDEFVRHTRDVIAAQENQQYLRRIEVISRNSENIAISNYIDYSTNTVYSVERDDNGKYCTAVTDVNLYKVPLHYRNQVFETFHEAQVALHFFAISNKLSVYTGDFSEFNAKVNPSVVEQTSEYPVENFTPDESDKIDQDDFAPSLLESVPTQVIGKNETSDYKEESNNEYDEEDDEDETEDIEETEIKINLDNNGQPETQPSVKEDDKTVESIVTSDSDYLKQYASFSGYSLEDKRKYDGALVYSGTKAFIIYRLEIDDCVPVSKAARKANAYFVEVEPKSVVKHEL